MPEVPKRGPFSRFLGAVAHSFGEVPGREEAHWLVLRKPARRKLGRARLQRAGRPAAHYSEGQPNPHATAVPSADGSVWVKTPGPSSALAPPPWTAGPVLRVREPSRD